MFTVICKRNSVYTLHQNMVGKMFSRLNVILFAIICTIGGAMVSTEGRLCVH